MAFVKLPSALRSVEIRRPDGAVAHVDFSVFAGEIEREQRARSSGAARWAVCSSRQRQTFDFLELPISVERGNVVAIVAAMPAEAQTGPIIAVADVDADQRVDFLHRESELLRLLSGYDRDYRRWRLGARGLLGVMAKGLALGAVVFLAALFVLGQMTTLDALSPARVVEAFVAQAQTLSGPFLAATLAALLGVVHGVARAWTDARRRARFQSRLLEQVWRAAGEAMGFVQDNASAFRPQPEPRAEPRREPAATSARPTPRRRPTSGTVEMPAFLSPRQPGLTGRAALN